MSRNRNWGHPELVQFVAGSVGHRPTTRLAGLYIGDMSQPRGGPMTSGHASHQIGLDADIWMLPPKRLNLSRDEREKISSISVRTEDQRAVNGNWTATHHQLLQAAASDPRVDRIFVAAAVKVEMCKTATRVRQGMAAEDPPALRPQHPFPCPAEMPRRIARTAQTQTPTVAELSKGGDGCDDTLTWWVTTYLDPPKNPPKKTKPKGPRKKGAARIHHGRSAPTMLRRSGLGLILAAGRRPAGGVSARRGRLCRHLCLDANPYAAVRRLSGLDLAADGLSFVAVSDRGASRRPLHARRGWRCDRGGGRGRR